MARHLEVLSIAIAEAVLGIGPKRVGAFMPPRHGKSQLCSVWTPTWFLGLFPALRVILASYHAKFAATWGAEIRQTMTTYQKELGVQISPSTTANDTWPTTAGGKLYTAGVGGGLTGLGGNLIVIDDPIKNAQEAMSPVYRQAKWDWYRSVAFTRLEPNAVIVFLMTRWNEDDLAGRIETVANVDRRVGGVEDAQARAEQAVLSGGGANDSAALEVMDVAGGSREDWVWLDMPAIAEEGRPDPLGRQPGEALWPERYDEKRLAQIKHVVGPWVWGALFQQRPKALGGGTFQRLHFRYWWWNTAAPERTIILGRHGDVVAGKPDDPDSVEHADNTAMQLESVPLRMCRIYMTVDPAISEKKTADYFVASAWAITPWNDAVLLDRVRTRVAGPKQPPLIVELYARWHPFGVGVESVAYQASLWQTLAASGIPAEPIEVHEDKGLRALSAGVLCNTHRLFWPRDAVYLEELEKEHLDFPNGAKDDQVDNTSMIAAKIADAGVGGAGVKVDPSLLSVGVVPGHRGEVAVVRESLRGDRSILDELLDGDDPDE